MTRRLFMAIVAVAFGGLAVALALAVNTNVTMIVRGTAAIEPAPGSPATITTDKSVTFDGAAITANMTQGVQSGSAMVTVTPDGASVSDAQGAASVQVSGSTVTVTAPGVSVTVGPNGSVVTVNGNTVSTGPGLNLRTSQVTISGQSSTVRLGQGG